MTYEDELINKAQLGDTEALNALCVHWRPFVAAICFKYFHSDKDTAEDAVQTTLIRLTHNIASFRCDSKLSVYLYTITRNVCHDIWKARPPITPEWGTEERVSADRFEEQAEARIALDQILAKIKAALTPESYRIFVLHYKLGWTADAISDLIGISPEAVRQRLSRTIRKVVREIGDVTI